MRVLRILFMCYILNASITLSARILAVFPSVQYSHHRVLECYVDELLNHGHKVVVITSWPKYPKGDVPANLTQIDVHNTSVEMWTNEIPKIFAESGNNLFALTSKVNLLIMKIIEYQFQTDEVKNLIADNNMKFDLMLAESYMKITLMVAHFYKLPVIEISTLGPVYGDFENIGAPVHPLMYPQLMRKKLNNLTLRDEISELYTDLRIQKIIYDFFSVYSNEVIKNTPFRSAPSIDVLKNNIHMLFINTHPVWDTIRPVPFSVQYTYGIHEKPYRELPDDLVTYLETSTNGIVYVSFGTTANVDLYSGKVQILLNAFSQLPYDFLFKWPGDELSGKPDNVKTAKWFPQADVLMQLKYSKCLTEHSKVKAFITQGGIHSTDEAINAGVPLIGIPLIWDQWSNVERYVRHGIRMKLEMDDITEEQIIKAVNTVISDDSYRTNIIKLRTILMDSPQRSSERVVRWTQYMLRHGGPRHLRAPAANMSYAEFFEIELFLILFTILFICGCIFYHCLCFIFKRFLNLIISAFIRLKNVFINVDLKIK